jgi:hypothetical protein
MKALVVVFLAIAIVATACGGSSGETAPGLRQKTAEDERGLGCLTTDQAAEHDGDYVLVCGTVAEAVYLPDDNRTTYIYFDSPSPDQTFTAKITGGSRSGFNPFPEEQFAAGTNACVEGVITIDADGKALIDVQSSLSMIPIETLEISGEHCTGN